MKKLKPFLFVLVIAALAAALFSEEIIQFVSPAEEVPYAKFCSYLETGSIEKAELDEETITFITHSWKFEVIKRFKCFFRHRNSFTDF